MAWQQAPESSRPRTCGSRSLICCCRSHSNLAVTNYQLADSRGGAPTSPVSRGSAEVAIRARGSGDCVTSLFENTICYFHSSSNRLKPNRDPRFFPIGSFHAGEAVSFCVPPGVSSRAGLPRTSEQECPCWPGAVCVGCHQRVPGCPSALTVPFLQIAHGFPLLLTGLGCLLREGFPVARWEVQPVRRWSPPLLLSLTPCSFPQSAYCFPPLFFF